MLTLLSSVIALAASGTASATYWNVFNIEGESSQSAAFVTYSTLADMLVDTNRLGTFLPNNFAAGANIVGSGSDIAFANGVPEPGTLVLLSLGLAGLAASRRRKQ
jgi:hypothetical protein